MTSSYPDFENEKALLQLKLKQERQLAMFKAILDLAAVALNAAFLVNGGAAVAMLAFVGTARANTNLFDTHALVFALSIFALGVFAALIATGLGYYTQVKYAQTEATEISTENKVVALLIFVSYVAFFVGAFFAAKGLGL